MRNNTIIILFFSTIGTQCMEQPNSFSITSYGTKITITQESLFEAADKVHLLVLGENEQARLRPDCDCSTMLCNIMLQIGIINGLTKKTIYKQNHDTYNGYKTFDHYPRQTIKELAYSKKISCECLSISEPIIMHNDNRLYQSLYKVNRPIDGNPDLSNFHGDNAINEACKDLKICYEKVLASGVGILHCILKVKEKSIAIDALSNDVGLSRYKAIPIATNTILTFVKNNPNLYDRIELFTPNKSGFYLYQYLFRQYYAFIQKACLLYYHDNNAMTGFSCLPPEIRNPILLFMATTKGSNIPNYGDKDDMDNKDYLPQELRSLILRAEDKK